MSSSTHALLARLISEPGLAAAVASAPPALLTELVAELGLADSFELLALAIRTTSAKARLSTVSGSWARRSATKASPPSNKTSSQVVNAPGSKLSSAPHSSASARATSWVGLLASEVLGIGMAGADAHAAALVEQALDACLYLEIDNYTLVCRDALAWDVVIAALLALDQRDHDRVLRLLEAGARAAAEELDTAAALHGVLTRAQMMHEDAGAERDDRRGAQGYLSRADALAFARLAEAGCEGVPERDPITRAYLRGLDHEAMNATRSIPPVLARLLDHEATPPASARASLPSPSLRMFEAAMAGLAPAVRDQRQIELVYLANVLVSLGEHGPRDAATSVMLRCAEGFARLREVDPTLALAELGCDQLYRLATRV